MTDLIPLAAAAAQALSRLVPAQVARSDRALRSVELIAREIAARIPVYARDAQSGALSRIGAGDLHAPGKELLVKGSDVEAVIEALVAQYVGVPSHLPPPAAPRGIARRRSTR